MGIFRAGKSKKVYSDTLYHKSRVLLGKLGAKVFFKRAEKKSMEIQRKVRQPLQGKLTYLSLAIGIVSVAFQMIGKTFPQEEAEALVNWANSNWAELTTFGAMLGAFWGRLRRELRNDGS